MNIKNIINYFNRMTIREINLLSDEELNDLLDLTIYVNDIINIKKSLRKPPIIPLRSDAQEFSIEDQIIVLFRENPDKLIDINEIKRRISTKANDINALSYFRKVLHKLVDKHILIKEEKGQKFYWKLNQTKQGDKG